MFSITLLNHTSNTPSVMMAAANSPDQRYPFTSNSKKGDGMPETLPPGDHSFSQQVMYNSPAVCGVVAQFPHQVRSSSMYESTPSSFSGEHQVPSPTSVGHQQMHMGYQHHHQPQKVQDEQSGQAMVTMQSMQGAPSIYPPSYLDTMDARSRYSPDFPHFSQAGPFASHEAAMDMVQTSRALAARTTILPYNREGRASTSTQGRREFPWSERHTKVLRQGKRAGKSAPEIVKDLYQIDGVERTPNLVSKRWGKMRQGCINKHVSTYSILLTRVHHEDGGPPKIEERERR